VTLRKTAKAGKDSYVVPLTVKGKRLAPGSYVVVVVVTAPGLPPQRRGFILILK